MWQCGNAKIQNECLALRIDIFSCDWMVLWDDWEENSGNDSVNEMTLDEDKDVSSTEATSPVEVSPVPSGNPVSQMAPSYSRRTTQIMLIGLATLFFCW